MKEARMILPLAWQSTVDKLTEVFGGTTVYSANGTWKSPNGTTIFERVQVVDIAYEPSNDNDAKLYDIAWAYGQSASQEEVYLRYGNGNVQMVTEKSCMDNGEAWDYHALVRDMHAFEDLERDSVSDVELDPNHHVEINPI